jgi:hypothetical protein
LRGRDRDLSLANHSASGVGDLSAQDAGCLLTKGNCGGAEREAQGYTQTEEIKAIDPISIDAIYLHGSVEIKTWRLPAKFPW